MSKFNKQDLTDTDYFLNRTNEKLLDLQELIGREDTGLHLHIKEYMRQLMFFTRGLESIMRRRQTYLNDLGKEVDDFTNKLEITDPLENDLGFLNQILTRMKQLGEQMVNFPQPNRGKTNGE